MILSDYKGKDASSFFSENWKTLQKTDHYCDYKISDTKIYDKGNKILYLKVAKYVSPCTPVWMPVMIFDKTTDKVCVISFSCVNKGEADYFRYIQEIVKAIHFNN